MVGLKVHGNLKYQAVCALFMLCLVPMLKSPRLYTLTFISHFISLFIVCLLCLLTVQNCYLTSSLMKRIESLLQKIHYRSF